MNNNYCDGLIYIDCMCNSGMYVDSDEVPVKGTALRVAEILRDVAWNYPHKQVRIYFNDMDTKKIEELKKHLPNERDNFKIIISTEDGNELLKKIGSKLDTNQRMHFFLFYDPYDTSIDWSALAPFFRSWGEVLINHVISDPIRAISQAKSAQAIQKYKDAYWVDDIAELLPFGSDKTAYEKRLEAIIKFLRGTGKRKYYIAAFPFFNSKNAFLYDLVHCTGHVAGFKLFKSTAWTTFGRKSSTKKIECSGQVVLGLTDDIIQGETQTDENCFFVQDIAKYLQKHFNGQHNVNIKEIWKVLDEHPIFPSDSYKKEIKDILVSDYGATKKQSTMSFQDRRVQCG